MMLLATLLMMFVDETPQPEKAPTSGAITVPGEFETTAGPLLRLPRVSLPPRAVSPTWMVASPAVPPPAPFDLFSPAVRPPQEFPAIFSCPPVAIVPCPPPAPALFPAPPAEPPTISGFEFRGSRPPQFFPPPFALQVVEYSEEPPAVRHVDYTEASGEFQVVSNEDKTEACKANGPAGTPVAQPDPGECPWGECPVKAFWQQLHAGPQAFAPPFIDMETGQAMWREIRRAGHPPIIHYHPPVPVGMPVAPTGWRPPVPPEFAGAKSVEHFVRAKYDVPHETAKALEPILEQSAGVLGCIVDGDELTVSAAPPVQASIAQFLHAVVTKPHNLVSRPVPAVSASHCVPLKAAGVNGPFKCTSETSAKAKCCNEQCDCKTKCDCSCSCGTKKPATGPSVRIISHPILNKIPYINRFYKTTGVPVTESAKPQVFHFSVGVVGQSVGVVGQTQTPCPNGQCAEAKCAECATTKCAAAKCAECSKASCECCGKKDRAAANPSPTRENIDALEEYYHNLGYIFVKIKPCCTSAGCQGADCEACSKEGNPVHFHCTIDKGQRCRVRVQNIQFHGAEAQCPNGNCTEAKCSTAKCAEAKCSECSKANCESCVKKETTHEASASAVAPPQAVRLAVGVRDCKVCPPKDGDWVAMVNGSPILASDILERFAPQLAEAKKKLSRDEYEEARALLIERDLDHFIERKLCAEALKLTLGNEQWEKANRSCEQAFEKAVARMMQKDDLATGADLEKKLREQHTSLANLKKNFVNQQLAMKWFALQKKAAESKPTQLTIRATSDGVELTTSNGTRLHARQIQLETNHIGRLKMLQTNQDPSQPIRPAKAEQEVLPTY